MYTWRALDLLVDAIKTEDKRLCLGAKEAVNGNEQGTLGTVQLCQEGTS